MNVAEKKSSKKTTKKKTAEKKTTPTEKKTPDTPKETPSEDEVVISVGSETIWKILTIVLGALLVAAIATNGFQFDQEQQPTPSTTSTVPVTESTIAQGPQATGTAMGSTTAPVTMQAYTEFQCPYSGRFARDVLPLIKENYIDTGKVLLEFHHFPLGFHANAQKASEAAECAAEQGKFWEMHDTLFANQDALEVDDLKGYASDLGLDTSQFNDCLDSGKYEDKVKQDMAAGAQAGVQGTPSFLIDGELVVGALPYETTASGGQVIQGFKDKLEIALGNPPPGIDDEPPEEPPEIESEYVILVSDDCQGSACDTSRLKQTLANIFPGATSKEVDVDSAQGQALVRETRVQVVPSYIFTSDVEQYDSWSNPQISDAFESRGQYYVLSRQITGATYFIDEEARAAYEAEQAELRRQQREALGVVEGDNRPQIDFFVMSYCPFGNQAEEGIEPVYQVLKDQAEFNPRYVIYSNYGGGGPQYCLDDDDKYCSMHGIQELNQNIRELCVAKYEGMDAWFEFALAMNEECTSSNADTCWEAVASDLGYDVEQIKACESEEGMDFAAENLELNTLLGVRGSPTVYIDGVKYEGGRTPAAYQAALCAAFVDPPAACEDVQQETQAAAPQGQC